MNLDEAWSDWAVHAMSDQLDLCSPVYLPKLKTTASPPSGWLWYRNFPSGVANRAPENTFPLVICFSVVFCAYRMAAAVCDGWDICAACSQFTDRDKFQILSDGVDAKQCHKKMQPLLGGHWCVAAEPQQAAAAAKFIRQVWLTPLPRLQ